MRNVVCTILIVVNCSLSLFASTSEELSRSLNLSKIFNVLKYVESNNDTDAIGDGGKAYGIVQIHKICIDDVNRIYKTTYVHTDAFDEVCAEEIFILYLSVGIIRYERLFHKSPTDVEVARMWNAGFYKGYKIKATIKYGRKYSYVKYQLDKIDSLKNLVTI